MHKPLGTIFATPKQLAAADKFADEQAAIRDRKASAMLPDCERRVEEGEIRYYKSATKFAVMGTGSVPRWFEIRKDGVYAVAK